LTIFDHQSAETGAPMPPIGAPSVRDRATFRDGARGGHIRT
jgi:hypothetical protein